MMFRRGKNYDSKELVIPKYCKNVDLVSVVFKSVSSITRTYALPFNINFHVFYIHEYRGDKQHLILLVF